jgi:FkbH-like protein
MAHVVGERSEGRSSPVLERLRDALGGVAPSSIDPARALGAYALLEPAGCLRFLAGNGPEVRALVTGGALPAVIDSALESLPRGSSGPDLDALGALAGGYRDVLTPASVVALLARFPQDVPETVAGALADGLSRAPHNPALLRAAIKLAERKGDFASADRLSTALGLADNTPATVASVCRSRRPDAVPATPVRVALLSTYTVDHLVPFVDLECRALGLTPQIYVAPFNSWTQEVIDESSGLRRFAADVTFLALAIDDLVPALAEPIGGEELSAAGNTALERVLAVVESYARWAGGKPLVVHAFHSVFESGPLGVMDGREGPSRKEWLAELNARLGKALRATPGAYLLDVREAVAQSGTSLTDNAKLRHVAAMRLPPPALGAVAKAYARYIAPLKGLTKKCVVLDLDNTLWGGVIGEDGKDGIRLGHASPGSEYVEFQHFLSALSRRGILLAVNSKNNSEEALDAIRTHESMVLREPAFSAIRVNWKPKPENMTSIAAELNIGLDSLVFVDDNPDEREMMRQTLPQVLTVELPKDPALYRSVLESLPQLQVLSVTEEDKQRVAQYQTARLREEVKLSASSIEDYLQSLHIEAAISPAAKPIFGRVAQLFARTNQFNVTTRRYSASDVERFASDPAWRLYVLSSKDRFGDHGLVAVGLLRTGPEVWTIDSLLMSCRVIGYGIESALLSFVSEEARKAGATRLRGEFVPTQKNAPAKGLYASHGFDVKETVEGVEQWERSLADGAIPCPPWIDRTYTS